MRILLKFAVLMFSIAPWLSSYAADVAILRNGNSIRHERREVLGPVTRLYLSDPASGYIEIPTDQIERFEPDAETAGPVGQRSTPINTSTQSLVIAKTAKPTPASFDPRALNLMVNGAGQRHQIDPDFINSVIRAESGFNSRAVSKKGAQGLMQLMPGTASQLGVTNSFDPSSNVEGGTKYLRELLEKYNYDVPKALAAYNAGPRRVDQYRGVPPYFETRTYVARIIRDYNRKKLAQNPSLAHKSNSSSGTASHTNLAQKPHSKANTKAIPKGPETASR